ncbi:MAG: hypothetical protein H6728_15380 [Myxococcales bacterium]|nr:hypothetical protein [Myxococcales bacterium]MCB9644453.1 hypothetical protein [Myxococcales bacterium]
MESFFPYEKISEESRAWSLEPADWRRLQRAEWVATEKIHGANFCVMCDGEQVRFGKRKGFLEEEESFFGHDLIASTLSDAAFSLAWSFQEVCPEARVLLVYGELYGGAYPHPDVAPVEGVQAVQTGVSYRPDIGFSVFDIAWLDDKGERRYLGFDQMTEKAISSGFAVAPLLFRGKMAEGLALSTHFTTKIPAALGLPALAWSNDAEGFVLRPVEETLVETAKGPVRPLLKRKHKLFSEDARYHQARVWSRHDDYASLASWEGRIRELATTQRVSNAVSKIGHIRPTDTMRCEQLETLLQEDIMEVLQEEQGDAWGGLSSLAQHRLAVYLREQSRAAMGDWFQKK